MLQNNLSFVILFYMTFGGGVVVSSSPNSLLTERKTTLPVN